MATFTDVYKQELKGKGVLSSLGSTMFKRSKERLDPRNILFGGSGITSAIGQKIFGKGYSALNKSSSGKSLGDSGMQSQALNALIISSKNQEAQLSIIAKNTMNSNAMARDMNVMRQNIMKLVTMGGGKASRGSDMFFKDAAARESAYESQFGKSGGSKSVSPVAISAVPKKEDSGGLLSTLVKAVGAISVAILTLGTKLVTELGGIITASIQNLGAVIKTAIETLGNVLSVASLGKALGGGGGTAGGKPPAGGKTPSSNGRNLLMMGGPAAVLALAYSFRDEIGTFINEQLKNAGVPNPSGSNVDPDGPRAGGIDIGNKVGYKAVEGGLAGYTAYRGAKTIAGMYKAPMPTAPSPMTKIPEGKPLTSYGSVGEKREMVKNKTMYEKVKAFFTKLSNNPKLMNVFKSKLLKRVGEAAMLRVVAIGTSIAAAPMTFGLSLVFAVGGAIWAINDLIEIYKLIFGEGGLYDEVMKEDVTESKSPTPVKSDEQVRLGMMADAAQASGNSSSSPSKANLLDIIAGGEAGKMGYDAANKGKAGDTPGGMPGLSNMRIGEVMQLQSEGKLFAAGRYQIIPKTLSGLMSGAYGNTGLTLNDVFDKGTQDKLAQTLIDKRLKQGGLDPIKQQYALSQEFASIANPYTGSSYYDGKGNNKASISTEQIQTALSGGVLNQASTAIASSMRESSSQPPVIAFSAPQTINNSGSSAAPQTVAAATNIDALELFFQAAAGVRPI